MAGWSTRGALLLDMDIVIDMAVNDNDRQIMLCTVIKGCTKSLLSKKD